MKKIKVLHVITSTVGGAGNSVLTVSKNLDKNKFDTTVLFGPGHPQDEDYLNSGLKIVMVKMSRKISPLVNLVGFFQIYFFIRKEKFDIVHTHCSIAGLLGRAAAKLASVPVVLHSVRCFASQDYQSVLKRSLFLNIERRMDQFTDHYVSVSGAMRDKGIGKKIMPPDKVSVIHNTVNSEPFDNRIDIEAKKKELGVKQGAPVVGFVGRFDIPKGLDYFLEAAVLVRDAIPSVQFLMVGDGPLRNMVEQTIERLGLGSNVVLTGWRKDIPELLQTVDVYCLSSLSESFGLSVLEAMLAEKPVVATNVEGIPEVVDDGVTGILVPPKDPCSIAKATIHLLNNSELALKMGKVGKKRAKVLFDRDKMVTRFEDLYDKLLES